MSVLVWLAIPLVALIVGIVWASWISRPARPAAMQESVEAFNRFQDALAHSKLTHGKAAAREADVRRVAQHTATRSE